MQIAKQAVDYPEMVFTTLVHHIDVSMLYEAYGLTRQDAAAGVDKVTAKTYAENLSDNIKALHTHLRSGRYKAPAVRRVWIDKDNGKKRPLGITAFEDKIVQRAVAMIIGPIYETMFYDFSYGFRPGRSAHQAVQTLRESCHRYNIRWIVNADITGLFDNIDHRHLKDMIRKRVNDGGIIKLIGKWLNAGVMEDNRIHYPTSGTPQGGVISPLLSNIFLHYVLDEWFSEQVKPRMRGRCFIVRFADDFIIGCELEADASRIMAVLPKRFSRYGLELHPDKSSLINFTRPPRNHNGGKGNGTIDYLGFTFYWGKSLKGNWVIKKKTMRKRLRRTLSRIWLWCRDNLHEDIIEQYDMLCAKLRGHYQYFGVRCNYEALEKVYRYTCRAWCRWLSRRSHKGKVRIADLLQAFPLPKPRIVHNI
jgi:group II intron reverse transcriptase/maturase